MNALISLAWYPPGNASFKWWKTWSTYAAQIFASAQPAALRRISKLPWHLWLLTCSLFTTKMDNGKDIDVYVRSIVYSDRHMRQWRVEDKEMVIDSLSKRGDGM
jgi:hypothetical protein